MLTCQAEKMGQIIDISANFTKREVVTKESTAMECLYNDEEIKKVFQYLKTKYTEAKTEAKQKAAIRNLTMFVCGITIGLRGGDLCSLKWGDVLKSQTEFKKNADFVPEKTRRCHKHIKLYWNHDMECAITEYLQWKLDHGYIVNLTDYMFTSQKGEHIQVADWWRIMETVRKEVGITQKIGTHGLRKTMAHQYVNKSDNKMEAILELQSQFGHADGRTTMKYACIEGEKIRDNKEKMAFLY